MASLLSWLMSQPELLVAVTTAATAALLFVTRYFEKKTVELRAFRAGEARQRRRDSGHPTDDTGTFLREYNDDDS